MTDASEELYRWLEQDGGRESQSTIQDTAVLYAFFKGPIFHGARVDTFETAASVARRLGLPFVRRRLNKVPRDDLGEEESIDDEVAFSYENDAFAITAVATDKNPIQRIQITVDGTCYIHAKLRWSKLLDTHAVEQYVHAITLSDSPTEFRPAPKLAEVCVCGSWQIPGWRANTPLPSAYPRCTLIDGSFRGAQFWIRQGTLQVDGSDRWLIYDVARLLYAFLVNWVARTAADEPLADELLENE